MYLLPPFRRRPETSQIFPGDHSSGWGHSVGRGMFLQVPTSSMGMTLPDAALASECLLGTSCADRRLSFLKRCKRVEGTQFLVVSKQAVRVLVLSWAWSMIWSTISGEIVIVVPLQFLLGRGVEVATGRKTEGRWTFGSVQSCTGPWNSLGPWNDDFSHTLAGSGWPRFFVVLMYRPVAILPEFIVVYADTDGTWDAKRGNSCGIPKQ